MAGECNFSGTRPSLLQRDERNQFRNDILPLKDKLYRLALRITFDTAEAEDIVQETLIRVWDKRNEWPQLTPSKLIV